MADFLFGPSLNGLAEALTLHQRRHEILASNVANVDTPGFKAKELDFKAALDAAFAGQKAEDDAGPTAQLQEDRSAPTRADGNTVDLDMQMSKLNGNGTAYLTLARILGRKL